MRGKPPDKFQRALEAKNGNNFGASGQGELLSGIFVYCYPWRPS
ncbi:hypothetical protein MYAER_3375 [Microcystis aeruginosa NIES-2549]|uniref:Uncharacterized protein n=1 Tax=Microcystis aeruginosa NIES-2549 TaxID=1641812 RepID=A0A0F6RN03_MICAE|nr:hypothetical protein MYAER_3375 [Microcystis aeruginosa NIES-2549]AOC54117.1 hypothetical protein amyaer_3412 [Microcystis aeruginosa NIES-2481]